MHHPASCGLDGLSRAAPLQQVLAPEDKERQLRLCEKEPNQLRNIFSGMSPFTGTAAWPVHHQAVVTGIVPLQQHNEPQPQAGEHVFLASAPSHLPGPAAALYEALARAAVHVQHATAEEVTELKGVLARDPMFANFSAKQQVPPALTAASDDNSRLSPSDNRQPGQTRTVPLSNARTQRNKSGKRKRRQPDRSGSDSTDASDDNGDGGGEGGGESEGDDEDAEGGITRPGKKQRRRGAGAAARAISDARTYPALVQGGARVGRPAQKRGHPLK